jgi:hypothetical protein
MYGTKELLQDPQLPHSQLSLAQQQEFTDTEEIPVAAPVTTVSEAAVGPHATAVLLHDGQHKIEVCLALEAISARMENQHTGHVYEQTLGSSDILRLSPDGFPEALQAPSAFYHEILVKALDAEQKSTGVTGLDSLSISCSSEETPTRCFSITITLSAGVGIFARRWPLVLELPIKLVATAEKAQQMALRSVRQDFEKDINRLERELRLLKLQLNQRVFFGVNHSVHMEVKKLVMQPASTALGDEERCGFVGFSYYDGDPMAKKGEESNSPPTCTQGNGCRIRRAKSWSGGRCPALNAKGDVLAYCESMLSGFKATQSSSLEKKQDGTTIGFQKKDKDHTVPANKVASSIAVQAAFNKTHHNVAKALMATATEVVPPLPSSQLAPLGLCRLLEHLELSGRRCAHLPD